MQQMSSWVWGVFALATFVSGQGGLNWGCASASSSCTQAFLNPTWNAPGCTVNGPTQYPGLSTEPSTPVGATTGWWVTQSNNLVRDVDLNLGFTPFEGGPPDCSRTADMVGNGPGCTFNFFQCDSLQNNPLETPASIVADETADGVQYCFQPPSAPPTNDPLTDRCTCDAWTYSFFSSGVVSQIGLPYLCPGSCINMFSRLRPELPNQLPACTRSYRGYAIQCGPDVEGRYRLCRARTVSNPFVMHAQPQLWTEYLGFIAAPLFHADVLGLGGVAQVFRLPIYGSAVVGEAVLRVNNENFALFAQGVAVCFAACTEEEPLRYRCFSSQMELACDTANDPIVIAAQALVDEQLGGLIAQLEFCEELEQQLQVLVEGQQLEVQRLQNEIAAVDAEVAELQDEVTVLELSLEAAERALNETLKELEQAEALTPQLVAERDRVCGKNDNLPAEIRRCRDGYSTTLFAVGIVLLSLVALEELDGLLRQLANARANPNRLRTVTSSTFERAFELCGTALCMTGLVLALQADNDDERDVARFFFLLGMTVWLFASVLVLVNVNQAGLVAANPGVTQSQLAGNFACQFTLLLLPPIASVVGLVILGIDVFQTESFAAEAIVLLFSISWVVTGAFGVIAVLSVQTATTFPDGSTRPTRQFFVMARDSAALVTVSIVLMGFLLFFFAFPFVEEGYRVTWLAVFAAGIFLLVPTVSSALTTFQTVAVPRSSQTAYKGDKARSGEKSAQFSD